MEKIATFKNHRELMEFSKSLVSNKDKCQKNIQDYANGENLINFKVLEDSIVVINGEFQHLKGQN